MEEYIKDKRPNLSKSSIKTYSSTLNNLYKKIYNDDENVIKKIIEKLSDVDKVIKYIKDIKPTIRKSILSALVVISESPKYRELMLEDITTYNKEEAKQTKTDKQTDNWVEKDELCGLLTEYENMAKFLYKKKTLTNKELQTLQDYIILVLYSGKYIPPRRSKDYIDFKIKNIDKEKDNYIEGNKLIFNSYKTAKTYGKQEVKIDRKLKSILSKWININNTDYLLFDGNDNKLSNVKLNQRLNKLFNKKAGVNQMRKTFLSDKYSDMIDKKNELNEDMKLMGSSTLQEKIYIKK
jgi:hypothetical protein